jgi:hypothetical protein
MKIRDAALAPLRGSLERTTRRRGRVIDHQRGRRESRRRRLEDGVDRVVIGEHEMYAIRATHSVGSIRDRVSTVRDESLRPRWRPVPHAN